MFLHIALCFCIIVLRLVYTQHLFDNGTHILFTKYTDHSALRGEGIFVRFLRNALDLLSTTFPERKLDRYCRVVSQELDKMEFNYTRELAKHFKYLSRMYREEIKDEMTQYRQVLGKPLKYRTEFLDAMNEVFTLRENLLFDDYFYDLRNYGTEDKLFIQDETRKVLNDVILSAIMKTSITDQRALKKKLKKAYAEYDEEY